MRKITDKKELMKLASFITMGDGGVYYRNKTSKNAYFAMNMIQDNEDFVDYCIDILSNVTNIGKYKLKKDSTRKDQFSIVSKSHPFFSKLRERIYHDKYKGMDWHAMKLLDWESLAILYMADGSLYKYKRIEIGMKHYSYTLYLNLKRLSYGDILLLKKFLKDKLDLEFNINKSIKPKGRKGNYYCLRLRIKDLYKFMNGVKPYILESFKYKMLNEKALDQGVK